MGDKRNAYRTLVGKSEGKRQLGSSTYWWKANVRMDFREIRWMVKQVNVAQVRD
jgi:hypothetical protein